MDWFSIREKYRSPCYKSILSGFVDGAGLLSDEIYISYESRVSHGKLEARATGINAPRRDL